VPKVIVCSCNHAAKSHLDEDHETYRPASSLFQLGRDAAARPCPLTASLVEEQAPWCKRDVVFDLGEGERNVY